MPHSDASVHDLQPAANKQTVTGRIPDPLTVAEEAMIDAQLTVDTAITRLTRANTPREFVAAIVDLRRDLRAKTAAIAFAPRTRNRYRSQQVA